MTAPTDPSTYSAPEALLTVDGLSLRVRASARRKRFALTVETDATLTLHTPAGRSTAEAEQFVRAHRDWLLTKRRERERTRPLSPVKQLADGEVFRYLGRTYRLAVSGEKGAGGEVRLIAGRLVMGPDLAAEPQAGRAALVDWYCRAGLRWTGQRLQPWAARMGVTEPELDVRDLGGRWGSYRPPHAGADAKGLMSLGWPLFQLPMHLIDYVIAHELAHVKVSGHREDFWRLLRTALPEYEERRADLDELGRRLWMGDVR